MVSDVFTISNINIARATMRSADRDSPLGGHVDIRAVSHEHDRIHNLYIMVFSTDGASTTIDVDVDAVQMFHDEPDFKICHQPVAERARRQPRPRLGNPRALGALG